MRNPEETKLRILRSAGRLFNTQGYKATSISDITVDCQLTKGAIYRHFEDKSHLEKEALLHMLSQMMNEMLTRVRSASNATEKLLAIVNYFESYGQKPPFHGGCPLMNAAIESDDGHPNLKIVVQNVMQEMHHSVCRIIENGKHHNQLKQNIDAEAFASHLISSLEGGVMMLKIMDNDAHIQASIQFLKKSIYSLQK